MIFFMDTVEQINLLNDLLHLSRDLLQFIVLIGKRRMIFKFTEGDLIIQIANS